MKIFIILFLSLALSGCGLFKPTIVYTPVVQPVICAEYSKPDPITTLPVRFVLANDEINQYVLGLDGVNYSNLAVNTARSLSYIRQQKLVIEYLENCIDRHNEKGEQ